MTILTLSFLIFIVCGVFFLYSCVLISGSFRYLTIVNVFGIYLSFNTLLPFTYGFFSLYGGRAVIETQIFLVLSLAFLSISMGIFAGNKVGAKVRPVSFSTIPSPLRIVAISIPFVLLGAYYMMVTQGYMSLFSALNGDVLEAVKIRTSATNALTGHGALYSLPFIYIFPALSLLSYLEYKDRAVKGVQKNRSLLFVMFLIFGLLAIAYSVVLLQKYYIVQLGLFFLVGHSIAAGARISYSKVLWLFIIAVIAIALLWGFYSQTPYDELLNAPLWVLERIFSANLNGLSHYIDYYNERSLLLGLSFPNTLGLLPYEPVSITKIISFDYIMTREQISLGFVGSHPTIYVGEILANFGYIGCVVASLYLGFILGFLNRYLSFVVDNNVNSSSVSKTAYAMLAIWSFEVVTGSLFSFLHHIFVLNEMILVTLFALLLCSRVYFPRKRPFIYQRI